MKTNSTPEGQPELRALRALARYETHGGYVWAAVMTDGECVCVPCVRANYRQIFAATKARDSSGWSVAAAMHSGESDTAEFCANCNKVIWEGPQS